MQQVGLSSYRGVVLFTGLSGAGKSTLANALGKALPGSVILDGDEIRKASATPRGFGREDRLAHIAEVAAQAIILANQGHLVICAMIAPYSQARDLFRVGLAPHQFMEVYVSTPLSVCEARDPKGLYQRARNQEITNFTGIDDPYEVPLTPDLNLDTSLLSLDQCMSQLLATLPHHFYGAPLERI